MSAKNLKAAASGNGGSHPPATATKTLAHLLQSNEVKAQIALALPKHLTPERMQRIALTELRRVPKLQQCDPRSFVGAVIQCAQLGLEPGSALGQVYILPFDKRRKDNRGKWYTEKTEAQVIIGYRGMIDLARRSGQIVSLDAHAVYEGDVFECQLGLDANLVHKPDWENPHRAQADKLRFVYAVAKLKDGGIQFSVMSRAEVDAIRARSKSKDDGPWATDYVPMALKTVIRRLFKYLPVSIELSRAIAIDERADAGLPQENEMVLEGEYEVPADEPEPSDEEPEAERTAKGPSYSEIAAMLNKAKTQDVRDMAMDMARNLPDAQRDELAELYNTLSQELEPAIEGEQELPL